MIASVFFSSESVEWATPPALFAKLARRFGPFDLDVCASPENAKCPRYYTREQDGLQQAWTGRCWCNPPYGRGIGRWVRKAWQSSLAGTTVVCLLPARTDTAWWHQYVQPFARVHFLRGRVKFGGSRNSAPFPSVVVVFSPPTRMFTCRWCEAQFRPRRIDSKFCSARCKQGAFRARQAERVTDIAVTHGIEDDCSPPTAGRAAPDAPRGDPGPERHPPIVGSFRSIPRDGALGTPNLCDMLSFSPRGVQ